MYLYDILDTFPAYFNPVIYFIGFKIILKSIANLNHPSVLKCSSPPVSISSPSPVEPVWLLLSFQPQGKNTYGFDYKNFKSFEVG